MKFGIIVCREGQVVTPVYLYKEKYKSASRIGYFLRKQKFELQADTYA